MLRETTPLTGGFILPFDTSHFRKKRLTTGYHTQSNRFTELADGGQVSSAKNMNMRLSKISNDEAKMSNRVNYLDKMQTQINKKIKETRVKAQKVHEIKGINEKHFIERIFRQQEEDANLI